MHDRFLRCLLLVASLHLSAGFASAQNLLFVTNINNNSVTVYPSSANGDVPPVATITGAATGLNAPTGLALDIANGEIYVANVNGNAITVYPISANGNVAPTRTIAGGSTGLNRPFGIAFDAVNQRNKGDATLYRGTKGDATLYLASRHVSKGAGDFSCAGKPYPCFDRIRAATARRE